MANPTKPLSRVQLKAHRVRGLMERMQRLQQSMDLARQQMQASVKSLTADEMMEWNATETNVPTLVEHAVQGGGSVVSVCERSIGDFLA